MSTVESLSQTSAWCIKKKTEADVASRCEFTLAFSLQDKTRLISLAVKRSERRLGARKIWPNTKVHTSAWPLFCDSQTADVIYWGMCENYVRKYM